MVDLGGEIEPSQCDLQKELHPGHDAVAIADRQLLGFDQRELEGPYVIGGRRLWRALEEGSKSFAALNVIAFRMPPQLASTHVVDHALPQRRHHRPRRGCGNDGSHEQNS